MWTCLTMNAIQRYKITTYDLDTTRLRLLAGSILVVGAFFIGLVGQYSSIHSEEEQQQKQRLLFTAISLELAKGGHSSDTITTERQYSDKAIPGCPLGEYMNVTRRRRAEAALADYFQR